MTGTDISKEYSENDRQRLTNILDYLLILAKYKKFIVRFVTFCIVCDLILFFLILPRWYKSTSVIVAPKQKNSLGLLSSISKATAPLRSLGLGASSDELSQFQTILQSRRCQEAVIEKFDLKSVYDLDNTEEAVKELESNVSISLGKEDVSLEISVFDKSTDRAAQIANYFVEILDKIYIEMSVAEAKGNREFLEIRYNQNLRDLMNAEDNMKTFQKKYGVYSVPEQVKAGIAAAATLQTQVALKEIQLNILRNTVSEDNTMRQSIELELVALKNQLASLKHGSKEGFTIFPPFEQTPDIGLQYIRYFREVEIQNKLLEFLFPLYEQAKIEEQRNTPSLIVLDVAVPTIKAAKPKRLLITILVTMGSFIISFAISLLLEYKAWAKGARDEKDNEKLSIIRRELSIKKLFR